MAVSTLSGAKLYVAGQHATATDTASEFAALTWTEVGEVEDFGELGDEATIVKFLSVGAGRARNIKGSDDGGTPVFVCGRDPLDPGQIILKAASLTKFWYDIKIQLNDRLDSNDTQSVFYFAGPVTSSRNNFGVADAVTKIAFAIPVSTPIIEVPSTVVP